MTRPIMNLCLEVVVSPWDKGVQEVVVTREYVTGGVMDGTGKVIRGGGKGGRIGEREWYGTIRQGDWAYKLITI